MDASSFRVLATDYDGTLASQGIVGPETIEAMERFVASGREIVLVTGRILDELEEIFPGMDLCSYVVAENGPVLYCPRTAEVRLLAKPPDDEFILALRHREVTPLQIGRVVVATREPHDKTVLEVIASQGRELQIIFNKGAVMVLPPGINKGIGLSAALAELAVGPERAVGVGDAENDHSLLKACGLGAAVANAVPTLQEEADVVLQQRSSLGVMELMERIVRGEFDAMAREAAPAAEPTTVLNAVPVERNTEQRG